MKSLWTPAIGIALAMASVAVSAQAYPSKPIRIAVGFAPGGSTDLVARIFAPKMSEALGQPVLVENRTGAAGSMAADSVAKGEPDGHRVLLLASGTLVYSVLSKNAPYNIQRDFTPIVSVGASPLVLVVNHDLPARNVDELVKLARSRPGALTYGSEGIGGSTHLAAEIFSQAANLKMLHVPFKGAVDSTVAVAAGQVNVNLPSLTSALPLLRADKFRPLAVTGLKRSPILPAVPTLDELGYKGLEHQVAWVGFVGPAGMPKEVVERLRAVITAAANSQEVKDAMAKQGMDVQVGSPEQFSAFMRDSGAQITRIARDAAIRME
jgi:tripartite-type tricarboxylate transporter receptor subunit TctC